MQHQRNLNFAACSEDEVNYNNSHYKSNRQDPMSHRLIEKRRRDRMNSCLANLSHLLPSDYPTKNRGRLEKTEIIEMAITYIKHLQEINSEQTKMNKSCNEESNRSSPSYKYKTNIKMRFSKDGDGEKNEKRCKPSTHHDLRRRTSSGLENYNSSSHSSSASSSGSSSTIKKDENVYNSTSQLVTSYSCNYKNIVTSTLPYSNTDLDSESKIEVINNFKVPLFALHTKSMFYVPVTIDYYSLLPFLQNIDLLNVSSNSTLHPVTINVNFQCND